MKEEFTIIYPNGKVQKVTTCNKTESDKAIKAIVKQKTNKKHFPTKSFGHLLSSFHHAIQWKQLRKQLSYPLIIRTVKKRWYIGAATIVVSAFSTFPTTKKELVVPPKIQAKEYQAALLAVDNSFIKKEEVNKNLIKRKNKNIEDKKGVVIEQTATTESDIKIPEMTTSQSSNPVEFAPHAKVIEKAYIIKYVKVAQSEQEKFGIPASITLGLAIVNSDFGTHLVAKEGNNHLLVNCEANPIPMGKGMTGQGVFSGVCYTRYENVWSSFRAHSEMLKRNYATFFEQKDQTYKGWVSALEDSNYFISSYKKGTLLKVIENCQLYKFDK